MLHNLGTHVLRALHRTGAVAVFVLEIVRQLIIGQRSRQFMAQCMFVGVGSLPIILLTAFFTGAVLALQSYNGLNAGLNGGGFQLATTQLGNLVSTSMLRELGPVLAALMLASRVGAAMAAELGTMRVTEQIDALFTLATNPLRYLVVPRVLACCAMLPLLVVLGNAMGILGGYVISTQTIGITDQSYWSSAMLGVTAASLTMGLVKAAVFGFLVGLLSTFHGYHARGGAQGVGRATTRGVVYASVSVLVADYFITALMS